MSVLNWFKSLFNRKTECTCDCCNNSMSDCIKITRRNFNIIIPIEVYNELLKNNLNISLSLTKTGEPSSVQLHTTIEGKSKYVSTLKTFMNVKSFKDGNVCNFNKNNIIEKE